MSFDEEIGDAFAEIAEKGMPVHFRLNNVPLRGVVRSIGSEEFLRESGYEPKGGIVVVIPIKRLDLSPDETSRERLVIADGPFGGAYVVVKVNADMGTYTLTALPTES